MGEGPSEQCSAGRGRCEHRRFRGRRGGQPLQAVESDVFGELFPGPVRTVEIPKDHGAGVRFWVCRMWQTGWLRPRQRCCWKRSLRPIFHPDSYGYRPGRSAHGALAVARKRCWNKDWVLDLDVGAFFDSVGHDLLMKAVCSPHRRAVGAALHRPVAQSPHDDARWNHRAAREGNPTRISDLAAAREPLHALCVRQVDGPGTPRLCVRGVTRMMWSVHCDTEQQAPTTVRRSR